MTDSKSLWEMVLHPWSTLRRLQALDRLPDRRVSRHRGPLGRGGSSVAASYGTAPDPVDPIRRQTRAQSINKALGVYALEESRTELYENYREMDSDAMLAAVLDAYGEDATQIDPETQRIVSVEAKNADIQRICTETLDRIRMEQWAFPIHRALARDGDVFFSVAAARGHGVLSIRPYEPWTVARLEDNIGRLIGFSPADDQGKASSVDRASVPHYRALHYRLPPRELTDCYGATSSFFWGSRITWRELQLMLDQIVIQRLLRRPDRLLVLMDATGLSHEDAWQTVHDWERRLHREWYANPDASQFLSQGIPLDMAKDVVLPRGPNNSTEIKEFPATNTNDIMRDVDLILAMLAAGIGFPLGFVGRGDPGTYQPGMSLSKQSQMFGKRAQRLQTSFLPETARLLMIDLAFKGIDPRAPENAFTLRMASVHPIAEIERNEMVAMKMDRLERALAFGKDAGFDMSLWLPLILRQHGGFSEQTIRQLVADAGQGAPQAPAGAVGDTGGTSLAHAMAAAQRDLGGISPRIETYARVASSAVPVPHDDKILLPESVGKANAGLVPGDVLPFGQQTMDIPTERVREIRRERARTRVALVSALAALPPVDEHGQLVAHAR